MNTDTTSVLSADELRDNRLVLDAALDEHGSDRAVALAVGVDPSTVTRWRQMHGLPKVARRGRRPVPAPAALLRDDPVVMQAALSAHRGSTQAVADAYGVSESTVRRWADEQAARRTAPEPDSRTVKAANGHRIPVAAAELRDDRQAMQAALDRHGSVHKVAAAVGVHASTVWKWCDAHNDVRAV